MKKLFLLMFSVVLCGCYSYVEYDALNATAPGAWAYDFDHPGLEKIDEKVLTVDFRRQHKNTQFFYIKVYSKTKEDVLFITRSKITGENYEREFIHNKRVVIEEEVVTYKTTWSGTEKVVLPLYRGFVASSDMSEMKLLKAAEGNAMAVEIFYLDEDTGEEKSVVFDIVKEHYKSWVPPT